MFILVFTTSCSCIARSYAIHFRVIIHYFPGSKNMYKKMLALKKIWFHILFFFRFPESIALRFFSSTLEQNTEVSKAFFVISVWKQPYFNRFFSSFCIQHICEYVPLHEEIVKIAFDSKWLMGLIQISSQMSN